MKSFKDFLDPSFCNIQEDNMKTRRIMAPQAKDSEALWNSTKDRWSRRAKHPLQVSEAIDMTDQEWNEGDTAMYQGQEVTVRIAPGTPTGRTLRVKGRGITKGHHTGDLLVTVEVQVPQRVDGKALDALKKFAEETASEDVRADFANKAKI